MTNKEWLATLSPQEWYMAVHWLFHNYGKKYDNTYLAIIAWLEEEKTKSVKGFQIKKVDVMALKLEERYEQRRLHKEMES